MVRLLDIRKEMLARGYHPKDLPKIFPVGKINNMEWQSLAEQIAVLKAKGCDCKV